MQREYDPGKYVGYDPPVLFWDTKLYCVRTQDAAEDYIATTIFYHGRFKILDCYDRNFQDI